MSWEMIKNQRIRKNTWILRNLKKNNNKSRVLNSVHVDTQCTVSVHVSIGRDHAQRLHVGPLDGANIGN